MPISFDRFRLLNDTRGPIRFRNESPKTVEVKGAEEDPPVLVPPGQEVELPTSETGETIIDVPS